MENEIEHAVEPPRFPCIETEKALSRAEGKSKALLSHLPEIWHRDMLKEIMLDIRVAREEYRMVLNEQRAERARLIELSCAS